eukprot:TRINITY_DN1112_c0_g1_i2.p1 TRINITY_DN1112_c0_g1~~TRINITY_DN1112_c0_g1_i2.p1  ORF type:complete len:389 (-),score=101.85 TRINITY_DN1112_c0_g1_i2:330-1496(-)
MSATSEMIPEGEFRLHPQAEALVKALVDECSGRVPALAEMAAELRAKTHASVVDFTDHLLVTLEAAKDFESVGFVEEHVEVEAGRRVLYHPSAIFPRVVVVDAPEAPTLCVGVALAAEDALSFAMARHIVPLRVEGSVFSPYRRVLLVKEGNGIELWAVERRGWSGFVPKELPESHALKYLACRDLWLNRQRVFADCHAGMAATVELAKRLVALMGSVDQAAWVAFTVEREHWQQRNWAAVVQKGKQDSFGLGWSNHDHHTFRSSREVFPQLIELLSTFGFHKREKFYAGAQAGWGAQVMEQPVCRFAVFADVDLAPEESQGDFSAIPLPELRHLGTVGLWCALHGESALSAGLHHLACRLSEFGVASAQKPLPQVPHHHPFCLQWRT